MIKIDLVSLIAPLLYIVIIVGSMATFSSLYRKRKAQQQASMEPWFPQSIARDAYLTLLHLPDSSPNAPKVPDSLLRAALLKRCQDVIQKAIQIRQGKQPLTQLLQRGSIGDDTFAQFQLAEQQVDQELKEIAEDAMALSNQHQQWGQFIFQSAAEMITNERLRIRLKEQEVRSAEWSDWWSKRSQKVRSEFLKSEGISEDAPSVPGISVNPANVLNVPGFVAATTISAPATPEKKGNTSDEDGVLVEPVSTPKELRPASVSSAGSTPLSTPSGSIRKKKGRK